jgi:hypothetical protein
LRQLHDGSQQHTRVEIKLDSFRLREVCESCNNGWMSQLETDAQPVILDLIRSQRNLSTLNAEERSILAAWAGKTAVIESRTVGAECPVSGDYLQQIRRREGRPPDRPMCVKSLYVPLWPDPVRWRDMDQTPMPAGLQGLEHIAALAERIELFQSVV